MPKVKDDGAVERDRLRAEPGSAGQIWRTVFGQNEAEFAAMMEWEEANEQSRAPQRLIRKYRPGRKA
ncbi:hypothetical protein [Phenylobacterium ferrooxidans]|uniref:Uncharacterized protein n=1 Tax=Phenylobacterium ferrooxidans TaxID=2982689 RepID=A0ABW6CLQ2_9CAUL